MKVIINDSTVELNALDKTLANAVLNSGIKDTKGLAVAVNDTIVPYTAWQTFHLKENDTVTIIHATQGG